MALIPLTPWLEHLHDHLPIARSGTDPEGVHQLRVAIRRLRVWLELAGYKTLEADLAWLVQGAGAVRDLEVLLGHSGLPKAFRRWAEERLGEARAQFVPMLDSARLEGLLQALSNLPPLAEKIALTRLERLEQRVKRRETEWQQLDTLEALHALRRALRKLRYAREWLELDTGAIKELQESFGRVGDWSFILGYVALFKVAGGRVSPAYEYGLQGRLEIGLQAARQAWQQQRKHPIT
jgi:CHAD domain-containing protein